MTSSSLPSIVIDPLSPEIIAFCESPLITKSTFVAVIDALVPSLLITSAAYPSASFWSSDVSFVSVIVICEFAPAIFTTLRPVRSELLIVTIAFAAELATFTV